MILACKLVPNIKNIYNFKKQLSMISLFPEVSSFSNYIMGKTLIPLVNVKKLYWFEKLVHWIKNCTSLTCNYQKQLLSRHLFLQNFFFLAAGYFEAALADLMYIDTNKYRIHQYYTCVTYQPYFYFMC